MSPVTAEQLAACPFCGDIEPALYALADGGTVVRCDDCGASGPRSETDEGAIAAWNRQALIAEVERLREALRGLLRVREWVIAAGGTEGPLPQVVIEQFAKMSEAAYAAARAALPEEPADDR